MHDQLEDRLLALERLPGRQAADDDAHALTERQQAIAVDTEEAPHFFLQVTIKIGAHANLARQGYVDRCPVHRCCVIDLGHAAPIASDSRSRI